MTENTCYITILSDCERFELSDLYNDNYKLYGKPSLTIFEKKAGERKELDFWDNSEYVWKMLKDLKKDKRKIEHTKSLHIKELKDFCSENDMDIMEVREVLLSMFQEAKKLGIKYKK